jgi:malate synthase
MTGIDDVVRRLSEVTDELFGLDDADLETRSRLETERGALRAQAAEFWNRKDARRSVEDLHAELAARRGQLEELRDQTQQGGCTGITFVRYDSSLGGTLNDVMMQAQGARSSAARIAELEHELARRASDF